MTSDDRHSSSRPRPGQDAPLFRHILAPFDGSDQAESALPLLERLARALHAEVTLARAVPYPVVTGDPSGTAFISPDLYTSIIDSEEQVAREYLEDLAGSFSNLGVQTHIAVRLGGAVEQLLALEQATGCDLVVMHTGGRAGPLRWLLGSVADAMVSRGRCPVLLTRRPAGLPAQPGPVLTPLDGSAWSEQALPAALTLAGALNTSVTLLRVLEPEDAAIGAGDPGATDFATLQAQSYLDGLAERYADLVVGAEVRRGAPADVIVAAAAEHHAALVVMASHGRTGLTRLRLGSVANQAVRRCAAPVLLVRPGA
ncbi:MAG: universal stress protein [Chloroflexi bacterium]|nr:universal stress protein [Chloroflexota bacterium]